jgi:hypothetical protein
MESHRTIILLILKRALLPITLGLLAVSALARVSIVFLDNPPRPNGLEQIVVQHQQQAARKLGPRDVLLIGDSSCLMNVAAGQLHDPESVRSFLNLGMVSIVPLTSFAQLVADHAAANSGFPKYVVLIIHPEILRREIDAASTLSDASAPTLSRDTIRSVFLQTAGILPAFERTVGKCRLNILPGRYGTFYGFDATLLRFLEQHAGSAIDPSTGAFSKPEPPTFNLSDQFRREASEFRKLIPENVKLFVVLSPFPENAAVQNNGAKREAFLTELTQLLAPATALNLPGTLPNIFFATPTHLRAEYRPVYTRLLNEEFRRTADLQER